jgi:hypothetical protein
VTTLADVASLPPTLRDAEAADIWGISADSLGEQARNNSAPVPPLYLGRSRRWPTVAVLRSVGIEWSPQAAPAT